MKTQDKKQEKIISYWKNLSQNIMLNTSGLGDECHMPPEFITSRYKLEAKIISEILDTHKPFLEDVLDLACGSGMWSLFFTEKLCRSIKAIEINPHFLEHASKILEGKTKKLILQNSDINEWEPIDNEKYDLIFCGGVLMYLTNENLFKLLGKIKKVMNDDSIFICRETIINSKNQISNINRNYEVVYRKRDAYDEIFRQVGFEIKDFKKNTGYEKQTLLLIPSYVMYRFFKVPYKIITPITVKLMNWGIYNLDIMSKIIEKFSIKLSLEQYYYVLKKL